MCNAWETIEGVGCKIIKTHSGNGCLIVVDGHSTDVNFPTGYPNTLNGSGGGLPDGTEIWGRVSWETIGSTIGLWQYKLTWNSATSTFTESETPELIKAFASHEEAHGVI